MTLPRANHDGGIQQQVITRALAATASEMGISLLRNAFSSIVREAKDMSTAVFSPDGHLVAQAYHIPIRKAPWSPACRLAWTIIR